jgi:tetratricopeptide (TPR) repeat protein
MQVVPRGWRKGFERYVRGAWIGVLLACVGTLLAVATTILAGFPWLRWLWVALVILGGVLTVLGVLRESLAMRAARRSRLAAWPLPIASQIDPYERLNLPRPAVGPGLAQSGRGALQQSYPYVPRAVDATLRELLRDEQLILLVGEPKAGKTRTAYEAVLHVCPNRRIVIPRRDDPEGLTTLLQEAATSLRRFQLLIWLDDLDAFLVPGGLATQGLDAILENFSDVRILATITARAHREIHGGAQGIADARREVVRRFRPVRLDLLPTDAERRQFHSLYPQHTLAGGFGEYFIAARELVRRLEDGDGACPFEPLGVTCPFSRAIVHAAVDWRRVGLAQPIPEQDLQQLSEVYARQQRPTVELTDDHFRAGLRWATTPLASHIGLLEPSDGPSGAESSGAEPSFKALDYVVGYVESKHQEVPRPTWDLVTQHLDPSNLNTVAQTAYVREAYDVAAAIWSQVVEASDPRAAAVAAVNLGVLREREQEYEKAEALWRRASESGLPRMAPMAANNLGLSRRRAGDFESAQTAFIDAVGFGDEAESARALFYLGLLLHEHGRIEDAIEAFSQAMGRNAPEAARAAHNLGLLLIDRGQLGDAATAFRRAVEVGDAEQADQSRQNLAIVLEKQGDVEGAERLYAQVVASGAPSVAPLAALNLGNLLALQGDEDRAEPYWKLALDSGTDEVAGQAGVNLGGVYADRGQVGEAKACFTKAIDSDHPDHKPVAMGNLALLLQGEGDYEGAKKLLLDMTRMSHPEETPRAWFLLGNLARDQDQIADARQAYERAVTWKHPVESSNAAYNLGLLLKKERDVKGARSAFQAAIDLGDPEVAPLAANRLAELLHLHGDAEGAAAALRVAARLGDPNAQVRADFTAAMKNAIQLFDDVVSHFAFLPPPCRPLVLVELLWHGLENDPALREVMLGGFQRDGMAPVPEWPVAALPMLPTWQATLDDELTVTGPSGMELLRIDTGEVPEEWKAALREDRMCAVITGIRLGLAEPDPETKTALFNQACERGFAFGGVAPLRKQPFWKRRVQGKLSTYRASR